jgi:hypothetical protein
VSVGEHEEKSGQGMPAGSVSSPRGYFGRASRAATGLARPSSDSAIEPDADSAAPPSRLVFRAGDPALRAFPRIDLPFPPTAPLTGAVATLSGVADGDHERLLIELGTSLIRATTSRDEAAGTFTLALGRTQSTEVYRALLATVRYVNDAAEPHPGPRRIVLQAIDAAGAESEVTAATIDVSAEAEPVPEMVVAPVPSPSAAAPVATEREAPAAASEPAPALDRRVVLGESMRFNGDGDFTLFWWPRLLANGRARRSREPGPETVSPGGAFFSQGGRNYRVLETESEPTPRRAPAPAAPLAPPVAPAAAPPAASLPANDVWMPGRGMPLPGFAPAPPLRLEDVFGSDMENALIRRLVEQRIAASG